MRLFTPLLITMLYLPCISSMHFEEPVELDHATYRKLRNDLLFAIIENDETNLILNLSEPFPLNREVDEGHKDEPLLCVAARHDRHVIIETLLANYNAKVNIQDYHGNTPLHHAVIGNHLTTARLLLRAKASLTVKNTYDYSPLHQAIQVPRPSSTMIRLLLKEGAFVNEPDEEGNTIAHLAHALDRQDILDVLEEFDVDWNFPNKEGLMPSQLRPQRNPCLDLPALPSSPEITLESSFNHALGGWYSIHTYYHLLELNEDIQPSEPNQLWALAFITQTEQRANTSNESSWDQEESSGESCDDESTVIFNWFK